MELMRLAAVLSLDDSAFKKGVNDAETQGQKLAGKLKASTIAAGNIIANYAMKGIDSINKVISGAVDGYADYEQLIGGVETLFKDSASKVSRYAKNSFKTTGLSANQYMETVTSFSASLLQGLGGDTAKAADIANMAVTDMADNANKMGTDISSIQTAYQGFAKQNYTMLDNLKLGYGGTKEEMVRLINDSGILDHKIKDLNGITFDQIIQAIHKVQTEIGITGTTAKEAADTISGSKASLKAAWEDLLSAVGGEGDQKRLDETMDSFKESFSTYMTNFIPTLVTTITNSGDLVTAIADSIASLPEDLLSKIGEGAVEAGTDMVGGLSKITHWLIGSITNLFKSASSDPSKLAELGNAVGDFIGSALADIIKNAPDLIGGLFNAGVTLAGSLIEGLFSGLFGSGNELTDKMEDIDKEMNDTIQEAMTNSVRAQGILQYITDLGTEYGEAAKETTEFKAAMAELNKLVDVPEWMVTQKTSLEELIRLYGSYAREQEKQAIDQAKRKALKEKEDAMIEAEANLLSAKANIKVLGSENAAAFDAIEKFFSGAVSKDTGEALNFQLDRNADIEQTKDAVRKALLDVTGGAGNTAYEEAKPQIDAWLKVLTDNTPQLETLEASVSDLESQVTQAKTAYLTSSAAVDELTGSASGAAKALALIKNPEMGYNSGQYYNWYYSNKAKKKAKGDWNVPYDNFPASLHRGEMVLTASQARRYRDGESGVSSEMVSAIQGLRNDMQNIKLVVGRKTFGRAVVNYGGDRVSDYIGGSDSRLAAGYGT